MKHYTQAIKTLLDGADTCSQVELLMRYSAANTIYEYILTLLEEPDYEELAKDTHHIDKLTLSLSIFRAAAVGVEDGHKNLSGRIDSSRQNLNKFEGSISRA